MVARVMVMVLPFVAVSCAAPLSSPHTPTAPTTPVVNMSDTERAAGKVTHWVTAIAPPEGARVLEGLPIAFCWMASEPGPVMLRIDAGADYEDCDDNPERHVEGLRGGAYTLPREQALPPGVYTWTVVLDVPWGYAYSEPRRLVVVRR